MKGNEVVIGTIVDPAPKKAVELVTDLKDLTDAVNLINRNLNVAKDVINNNAKSMKQMNDSICRVNGRVLFTASLVGMVGYASYAVYKKTKKLEERVIALEVKGASDDELYFSDEEKTEE